MNLEQGYRFRQRYPSFPKGTLWKRYTQDCETVIKRTIYIFSETLGMEFNEFNGKAEQINLVNGAVSDDSAEYVNVLDNQCVWFKGQYWLFNGNDVVAVKVLLEGKTFVNAKASEVVYYNDNRWYRVCQFDCKPIGNKENYLTGVARRMDAAQGTMTLYTEIFDEYLPGYKLNTNAPQAKDLVVYENRLYTIDGGVEWSYRYTPKKQCAGCKISLASIN